MRHVGASPLYCSISTPPEDGEDEQIKLDFYRRMKPLSSSNSDGTMKAIRSTLPVLPPGMDATMTKKEEAIMKDRELSRETSAEEEPKSDIDLLRDQMKKLLDKM